MQDRFVNGRDESVQETFEILELEDRLDMTPDLWTSLVTADCGNSCGNNCCGNNN